ncbi:MAG: hypothetical protein COT39_03805 [Parcubacteria group bacterium CG08_land_8_20_14_0_20_48_21]|nr:MAG: hypothetical protein COT39_03805 [Parcubacteria group bacterium CG08_land_8_20_14_0_20_48_21]PIY77999.1 MAG: hypothetical protein COY83_02160 [Parcubacteria group bacterium CG_4_10_14_0_8_um_filter_48_154]PIZ77116.1 MAG: hypothetical protein COY03_03890 [bacterium CG_4_10_14_0_2_um_filter_48_144]PJC39777.1 MAG: hypothetical protein CO043_02365 [Parcubacteria group bacterium CG_4_9_14_0_2_um_filter_48_40]
MHTIDLDMKELTKVEGAASLHLRVRKGKVEKVEFAITEYKRFYTQAMQGKNVIAVPQLLARICGTCSNAHLLCSIEACEHALDITPTEQTLLLRKLTMYGLNIRDHALHLYLFVLPDIYGKDAFLDFDENDPEQHQHLHDGFQIKEAGNLLALLISGRSVHAPYPTIGGFTKYPDPKEIPNVLAKLKAARPAALRLVDTFVKAPFHFDRQTNFMALVPKDDAFGYLDGCITTGKGDCIEEQHYREHLERVVLPYSQALGYRHKQEPYMVGALARINLNKDKLHPITRGTLGGVLQRFPSTDIYDNNLAQAVEVLHCMDHAVELLENTTITPEPIIKNPARDAVGIGVVEAPRGTLYHKVVVEPSGKIKEGEIVVPTGQNQLNMEEDIGTLVGQLLPEATKETIQFEIEKLIRAYDPCMSCASHFLKVNWDEGGA